MRNKRAIKILLISGAIPVIVISQMIAPFTEGGIFAHKKEIKELLSPPFQKLLRFSFSSLNLKVTALFLLLYLAFALVVLSSVHKKRPGEEYGSAAWGEAKELSRRYREKEYSSNKILSANVLIGLDSYKHRRNLNTLVIGGSGAGKTRFYGKPNILQANTSFVILDPKA